jgi:putative SOS response-associated peptidase YedK
VQSLFDHDQPGGHHRAVSRRQPVRRQPRADARRVSGLQGPIVRNGTEGRELTTARWGMPSSQHALMEATKKRATKLEAKGQAVDFKELLRMEPDGGTTNIRNVKSKHWTRWLGVENRCVVPFNSFSESIRPREVISGLRSTSPALSPASPASGPTGRRCGR